MLMLVPRQAVTLLCMTQEAQVRLDFVIYWRARMLEIVKNVHLAIHSLGCDDLRVLRHVPSLINFTLMINLHVDGNTRLLGSDDIFTTNAVRIVV